MSSVPNKIHTYSSSPVVSQKKEPQLKYLGVPWTFLEKEPIFQTRPNDIPIYRSRNNSLTIKNKNKGIPLFMNSSTEFDEGERDLINRCNDNSNVKQRSLALGGDSRVDIAKAIHIQSMNQLNDFFEISKESEKKLETDFLEEKELISSRSLKDSSLFENDFEIHTNPTQNLNIELKKNDYVNEEIDKPQLKKAILTAMHFTTPLSTKKIQSANYTFSNDDLLVRDIPNNGRDQLRKVISKFSDSNLPIYSNQNNLIDPQIRKTFCSNQLNKYFNEKKLPLPPFLKKENK